MLTIRFFARVRETLGADALELPLAENTATLDALQATLSQRGEAWRAALAEANLVRAVNHEVAHGDRPLADGDEVAFYPTGYRGLITVDTSPVSVAVQVDDFDPGHLQAALHGGDAGAVVAFTGYVRRGADGVDAIELEHYPGMTEHSIEAIAREALARWSLIGLSVVHRIGELPAGSRIVWVGASATHRGDAFAACEFVMDYLKTRAPFWKKERGVFGERWVQARASDWDRAGRWADTMGGPAAGTVPPR